MNAIVPSAPSLSKKTKNTLCNPSLRGVFSCSRTPMYAPVEKPPRALTCVRLALFFVV
jgi:hypothetical protein